MIVKPLCYLSCMNDFNVDIQLFDLSDSLYFFDKHLFIIERFLLYIKLIQFNVSFIKAHFELFFFGYASLHHHLNFMMTIVSLIDVLVIRQGFVEIHIFSMSHLSHI